MTAHPPQSNRRLPSVLFLTGCFNAYAPAGDGGSGGTSSPHTVRVAASQWVDGGFAHLDWAGLPTSTVPLLAEETDLAAGDTPSEGDAPTTADTGLVESVVEIVALFEAAVLVVMHNVLANRPDCVPDFPSDVGILDEVASFLVRASAGSSQIEALRPTLHCDGALPVPDSLPRPEIETREAEQASPARRPPPECAERGVGEAPGRWRRGGEEGLGESPASADRVVCGLEGTSPHMTLVATDLTTAMTAAQQAFLSQGGPASIRGWMRLDLKAAGLKPEALLTISLWSLVCFDSPVIAFHEGEPIVIYAMEVSPGTLADMTAACSAVDMAELIERSPIIFGVEATSLRDAYLPPVKAENWSEFLGSIAYIDPEQTPDLAKRVEDLTTGVQVVLADTSAPEDTAGP